MTVQKLRQLYVKFFESKGHLHHASGSLIPYDVTGRLDESLLFNGAGMIQFKPYFRGTAQPPSKRLVTVQKCVRTGDIDEVGDHSHLTFFEMLGNFSFGDYFKVEAIQYSWEFLTGAEWLALDPTKLSFTIFESDDLAYDTWAACISEAGIDPATRIFRLGEETNYWPAGAFSNGPPGPCGPNSEMFYWTSSDAPPSGSYSVDDYLKDEGQGKWLEIWNDVFIQFDWQGEHKNPERPSDGYRKTGMPDLPFQSIDTGMGLERTAAVLNGFSSVYETDAFTPIIKLILKLAGDVKPSEARDRAVRIISDHIRTASFCIADGILPANNGRGYVLRRLIRRGVLKGQRVLGFNEPFFHQVFDAVLANMGEFYPGLAEQAPMIRETLVMEEQLFRRTLHRGVEMLNSQITELQTKGISVYSGDAAFLLYDTFGFPLEVTQEICAEEGLTVDIESYETAMAEAQERSRGASGMDNVYGGVSANFDFENQESGTPTQFVGYEFGAAEALIVGALPELNDQGLCTGRVAIALNTTPFYAESGGQVADLGVIIGQEFELGVVEVVKQNGIYIHLAELTKVNHPEPIAGKNAEDALAILHFQLFDKPCIAQVDLLYRSHVQRNHTATHLLHAALRNTLGKHVTQAGSLVEPRHLRFDFTHSKAISVDELATIEAIVNQEILINTPVVTFADLPIDEARARGAMALFGEKYGNRVRMVEIGDFSRELCGGIHVGSTGEIGLFKITHEGSAASGVRRIEAVTGVGAYTWLNEQLGILREAATALKTTPKEIGSAVLRLQDQLRDERKKRERLAQQGATGEGTSVAVGGLELVVQKLDGAETKDATLVADKMVDGSPLRVAVIAAISEGKLSFVCKVGAEALAKGAHAGNILREVAKVAGGGGGGRAEFATAGGKDIEKADDALAAAEPALAGMLK